MATLCLAKHNPPFRHAKQLVGFFEIGMCKKHHRKFETKDFLRGVAKLCFARVMRSYLFFLFLFANKMKNTITLFSEIYYLI
jgi:hypothetical protein